MAFWRFLDYRTEDGRNPIREWYDSQDARIQAAFDGALLILSATKDWLGYRVKQFKVLTGKHSGLCEIRLNLDIFDPVSRRQTKRRFRPVGVWRPANREFILLVGCEKSGRIYTPARAFDLALEYKRRLEEGRGDLCEHK